jgi:hypothetical protein
MADWWTNGFNAASCALRWKFRGGDSAAELLRLLREHAGSLRQLQVR